MANQIRTGQRVGYERYGEKKTGTIVRTQWYSWCTGASEFTVLEDGSDHLVAFPWYGLEQKGQESLDAAKSRYIAHLRQYPVWSRQLDNGIDPTDTWGDFEGFKRRS